MEIHTISPVYDEHSRILILGSFPSVKSRETGFFYGHPQNRFWRVISAIFGEPVPADIPEKRDLLLRSGIAVWDVIKECDIKGSGDVTIKNAVANDISPILQTADIRRIFCNGQTSYKLYTRLIEPSTKIKASALPSTSPANASYSLERLIECWKIIKGDKTEF